MVSQLQRPFAVAALLATVDGAQAAELTKLKIVIFQPPSLGAFLPPIIKSQKLDEKNGWTSSLLRGRLMPIPSLSSVPQSRTRAGRVQNAAAPRRVTAAHHSGARSARSFPLCCAA
jgi:hypothetical protein